MDKEQSRALVKLLNIAKVEMLDWFSESVIGHTDSKQRFLVDIKRKEVEKSNNY